MIFERRQFELLALHSAHRARIPDAGIQLDTEQIGGFEFDIAELLLAEYDMTAFMSRPSRSW